MTLSSTCGSSSIFQGDELKPGVYKIQNLSTENYLDVHLRSMQLCCRPAKDLEGKRGLWKIRRLGDGYAVWRVDPGNPYQFCSPMKGLADGDPVCVTPYPVGWRIQRADDSIYRGFGFVRFHFGSSERTWDLWDGCKDNGAPVNFYRLDQTAVQVWRLIPVEVESVDTPLPQSSPETFGLGLPPYDLNEPGQSSSHTQHMGSERDDFGTVVTEVTTVTTRKKYRVDG